MDLTGLDGSTFRAGDAARGQALYRLATTNPPGAQDGAVVNSAAWRAAEIPAVNGHGTAAAVAGFYHALATGSLLSPGMLAEAVTPQCAGPDRVFGDDTVWGLGFGISDDGYGMGGLSQNLGARSTAGGYTVGYRDRQRRKPRSGRHAGKHAAGMPGAARPSRPPATRLREAQRSRPLPVITDHHYAHGYWFGAVASCVKQPTAPILMRLTARIGSKHTSARRSPVMRAQGRREPVPEHRPDRRVGVRLSKGIFA